MLANFACLCLCLWVNFWFFFWLKILPMLNNHPMCLDTWNNCMLFIKFCTSKMWHISIKQNRVCFFALCNWNFPWDKSSNCCLLNNFSKQKFCCNAKILLWIKWQSCFGTIQIVHFWMDNLLCICMIQQIESNVFWIYMFCSCQLSTCMSIHKLPTKAFAFDLPIDIKQKFLNCYHHKIKLSMQKLFCKLNYFLFTHVVTESDAFSMQNF